MLSATLGRWPNIVSRVCVFVIPDPHHTIISESLMLLTL